MVTIRTRSRRRQQRRHNSANDTGSKDVNEWDNVATAELTVCKRLAEEFDRASVARTQADDPMTNNANSNKIFLRCGDRIEGAWLHYGIYSTAGARGRSGASAGPCPHPNPSQPKLLSRRSSRPCQRTQVVHRITMHGLGHVTAV